MASSSSVPIESNPPPSSSPSVILPPGISPPAGVDPRGVITVFSLSSCPHCLRTKALFTRHRWAFSELSLSDYPHLRRDMLQLSNRLTVPQVFFNNFHIGGADEVFQLEQTGELEEMFQKFIVGGNMDYREPNLPRLTERQKETRRLRHEAARLDAVRRGMLSGGRGRERKGEEGEGDGGWEKGKEHQILRTRSSGTYDRYHQYDRHNRSWGRRLYVQQLGRVIEGKHVTSSATQEQEEFSGNKNDPDQDSQSLISIVRTVSEMDTCIPRSPTPPFNNNSSTAASMQRPRQRQPLRVCSLPPTRRQCTTDEDYLYDEYAIYQDYHNDKYDAAGDGKVAGSSSSDGKGVDRLPVSTPIVRYPQKQHDGGTSGSNSGVSLTVCRGEADYLLKTGLDERLMKPSYPPVPDEAAVLGHREERKIFVGRPGKEDVAGEVDGGDTVCFSSVHGVRVSVLVRWLLENVDASDRRSMLRVLRKAFKGVEMMTAICQQFGYTAEDATHICQSLMDEDLFHSVTYGSGFVGSNFYRLQMHDNPMIVNTAIICGDKLIAKPMALLKYCTTLVDAILKDHTNSETGLIDYIASREDKRFLRFALTTCELQQVDLMNRTAHRITAFVINCYNLIVKHAYIQVGIPESTSGRYHFFNNVSYIIGGFRFTLHQLENGILRANRRPPFALSKTLGFNDQRNLISLKRVDCRIHFALNCGARSCPPVKYFTEEAIQEELGIVAMAFCEDDGNVGVDVENRVVSLSRILYWYARDFGTNNIDICTRLCSWCSGEKEKQLTALLSSCTEGKPLANIVRSSGIGTKGLRVKYNAYDWSSNSCNHLIFSMSTYL
eukprot:GHVS01059308.1.p1 GENE.GHVS01059308.1~~GHVS01059308.1.p1  ORF type:complete len:833 (+),score=93.71 GHVS01059308.1:149-2647(+)